MADSLRDEIRACIREELQKNDRVGDSQVNNRSLVERTRTLIEASASSASQILSSATSTSNTNNVNVRSKRSVPGHALRFGVKKQKVKEGKTVKPTMLPKTVYLIDEVDCDAESETESDYSLTDSMILIKGECDLNSTYSEDDIRTELVDLFRAKLPLISKRDFDFVRRERNSITTPVVKAEYQWDFKHVKHLCGQGKLYVRLNIGKDLLVVNEEIEEGGYKDEPSGELRVELEKGDSVSQMGPAIAPLIPSVINLADDQEQSTSTGSSYFDDNLACLTALFPDEDTGMVRDMLIRYDDVELAADVLSDESGMIPATECGDESVPQVLKRLKAGMKSYGSAEKFKVYEEDLSVDFFQYYKSCEFDPQIPIKIQLKGQPAIDSGGILRQSY